MCVFLKFDVVFKNNRFLKFYMLKLQKMTYKVIVTFVKRKKQLKLIIKKLKYYNSMFINNQGI